MKTAIKTMSKTHITIWVKIKNSNIKKMSFLKISDPVKRDTLVKEYLDLKKNIRDNLLSERTGEMKLQTELSKFYRPITETQKATAREITEGLKPIREGIEKLPQSIQPIGEATGEEEEEEEEEDEKIVGEIAYKFLNRPHPDRTFGIRKENGHHYIRNKHVIVEDDDITIRENGERFEGTPGLWELITSKFPKIFTDGDYENYSDLMIMTNAMHRYYNENNNKPRSSKSYKWLEIIRPIWNRKKHGVYTFPKKKEGYEGEGVVIIPSDPNALLERLDLLLASQEAGHTGVRNELVSICDELKRQGFLDTKAYKKINSIIKNDSH